jgi:hypothetical protein
MTKIDCRRALHWHIAEDDYFGTLATILELLRQRIEHKGYGRKDARLLEDLREELVYLQGDYEIVRRSPLQGVMKGIKA